MTFYQFFEIDRLCAKLDPYLPLAQPSERIARQTHLTPIAIALASSYALEIGGFRSFSSEKIRIPVLLNLATQKSKSGEAIALFTCSKTC